MATIPDALADHHLLVSSLGGGEEKMKEKNSTVKIESSEQEEDLVEGVFLTQDKPAGHLLQLEDGSTVFVSSLAPLINGQTITLEDGTTAFIQTDDKDGGSLQAVELEDGSTAYIQLMPEMEVEERTKPKEQHRHDDEEDDKNDSDTNTDIITIKEQVTREKIYKCTYDDCDKSYTTLHHLKVHERKHTGIRPYKCVTDGCTKAFSTSYGLKSHVRTHTGEKPYECPEETCKKGFKTSGDLQKHVRTHTGERPFHCPFEGCDRSFTTSNIRKVHMRTHTGERPYVCPEPGCDRSFASATNYKNHLRIHSGEKPYVCSIEGCNKRFTEYSSLYKHHIVHSQQKPYFCSVCTRNYRQAYTLTMHKRTAHGIIEGEDGTEIVLDEELAAELFASTSKRKRSNVTVQPTEAMQEVCVQLVDAAESISGPGQTTTLVAMQGASAHTIQQVAKAAASCNGQTQIYFVADPTHLAALQQIGVSATATVMSHVKNDSGS